MIRIKSDLLRLVPTLCGAIPRTGFATTFIFREREVSGAGARPCSPQPPTLSHCQPGARTWIKYRESRSSVSRVSRPHETLAAVNQTHFTEILGLVYLTRVSEYLFSPAGHTENGNTPWPPVSVSGQWTQLSLPG